MGKRGFKKSVTSSVLPTIGDCPDPPAWLDGIGLTEWKRVRTILQTRGLLSSEDWSMLNVYGGAVQMMYLAACEISENGITSIAKNGMEIQSSAVGTFNKAAEQLIRVSARLGLSPADRASLTSPAVKEDDGKAARYFNGSA